MSLTLFPLHGCLCDWKYANKPHPPIGYKIIELGEDTKFTFKYLSKLKCGSTLQGRRRGKGRRKNFTFSRRAICFLKGSGSLGSPIQTQTKVFVILCEILCNHLFSKKGS